MLMRADQALPALEWLRGYNRESLINDGLAAVIVTIMLIPQSLAYALLAGLPAEMGLYASILPLIAYALFGSSRTLSVGPVAVASLMTASAVGAIASQGVVDYASAATLLALLGGLMLIAMGLLKFGFVSHFLSHPVVSGFITASAIIIALGQLGPLLGVPLMGATLPSLGHDLFAQLMDAHGLTVAVGLGSVGFLLLARYRLSDWLSVIGLRGRPAELIIRSAPVLVMAVLIPLSAAMSFEAAGVSLVGHVPNGLPAFSAPHVSWPLIQELALPAFLIALIGFIESVSVGKTLGAKRRQRIDPDQELIGLGAANTAAAISGGFPVTGGFSRSVVNFDAGCATIGFHHFVRHTSGLCANLRKHLSHESLHGVDGFGWVCDCLTLCGVANFAFSILNKGDHGRGCPLAFAVVDDHGLVALHDGDTRVGGAEVDADDFAHSIGWLLAYSMSQ